MKQWDNRVQFTPNMARDMVKLLEGTENEPDKVRLHQDDRYNSGKPGEMTLVWDLDGDNNE